MRLQNPQFHLVLKFQLAQHHHRLSRGCQVGAALAGATTQAREVAGPPPPCPPKSVATPVSTAIVDMAQFAGARTCDSRGVRSPQKEGSPVSPSFSLDYLAGGAICLTSLPPENSRSCLRLTTNSTSCCVLLPALLKHSFRSVEGGGSGGGGGETLGNV